MRSPAVRTPAAGCIGCNPIGHTAAAGCRRAEGCIACSRMARTAAAGDCRPAVGCIGCSRMARTPAAEAAVRSLVVRTPAMGVAVRSLVVRTPAMGVAVRSLVVRTPAAAGCRRAAACIGCTPFGRTAAAAGCRPAEGSPPAIRNPARGQTPATARLSASRSRGVRRIRCRFDRRSCRPTTRRWRHLAIAAP